MKLQFESPKVKTSILFTFSLLLSACGGGSDDSQTTKSDADKQPDKVEASRLVWEKLLPTTSFAYYSSPALSADEQTIYIGTAKNVRNDPAGSDLMVAYNRNGSEKWRYTLPNGEEVRSSPVVHNENIYFTVDKRVGEFEKAYRDLVALNSSGEQMWRQRVSDYGFQTGSGLTKVAAFEGQVIYTGLDIRAFNAQTGESLFERLCNCVERQDRFVNGAVNHNGELVFYDEGRVLKLDLNSYELVGEFKDIDTFEGDLVYSTPAIDSNNNIYFGSEAGVLYSFDDNLDLRWQFELTNPQVFEAPYIRSSVAIDESRSTIYFGTKNNDDSEFYALDINDKSIKWQVAITGDVYVSPTIGDNGNVYFSSESNLLYTYKPDGTLAWQYDLKANVTWSSPAIDSQGVLYIGTLSESNVSAASATGKLVAIQTDSTGLMPNTWSKIHRDNQNSGVVK
ncbi:MULTISPECIES: PQQ-binding-like beta-propeller repeat protein [unclassified Pseudoalteromonas]|uniref:PQQ-binding-like beta-propeller repeat protein n=1 Tax=unclassified Pseudoalteromonas TaxID=194690 RepID=UPI001C729409|nr:MULTISPECIES: PQQ-binding-like beta-propeller repeat protein [unclassified Pseudoalteromonas]